MAKLFFLILSFNLIFSIQNKLIAKDHFRGFMGNRKSFELPESVIYDEKFCFVRFKYNRPSL